MIAFGGVLIWAFVQWQHRRERVGKDPLVHLGLLRVVLLSVAVPERAPMAD